MHLYLDPHFIHIGKPLMFLLIVLWSALLAGIFEAVNRKNEQRLTAKASDAERRHEGQVNALTANLEQITRHHNDKTQQIEFQYTGQLKALAAQNLQLCGITQQYNLLNNEQNEIAVFLRDNYADEIGEGRHNTRTFSSVVIGYLKKEREYARRIAERSN